MVDTSDKATTRDMPCLGARPDEHGTLAAVKEHRTRKAIHWKQRGSLDYGRKTNCRVIPLCHPLRDSRGRASKRRRVFGVLSRSGVSTKAQTGVEMEALTAVSIAALTIYDMCKALDKSITISDVRLEMKSGGKSGNYEGTVNSTERLDSEIGNLALSSSFTIVPMELRTR